MTSPLALHYGWRTARQTHQMKKATQMRYVLPGKVIMDVWEKTGTIGVQFMDESVQYRCNVSRADVLKIFIDPKSFYEI